MSTPGLFGSTISLADTIGFQQDVQVTALKNGMFVAVWTDTSKEGTTGNSGEDTSGYAVRAQIFNSDGTRHGAEFQINSTSTYDQFNPSVAVLSDGRFVVAWNDTSQAGVPSNGDFTDTIRARIFNSDGTPSGIGDFLVNRDMTTQLGEPSVTALSNGGFTISYTAFREGASSPERLKAQSFDASGHFAGNEQTLDAARDEDGTPPITLGLGANYAVIYSKGGSGFANTDPNDHTPAVSQIHGMIRTASGSVVKNDFTISTSGPLNISPEATVLKDGHFVVAWASGNAAGTSFDFKAQIFNADGSKFGQELQLASHVDNIRTLDGITATADGGFAFSYLALKGSGYADIHFRAFDALGAAHGNDLIIGQTTAPWPYDVSAPSMATLSDGHVITMWQNRVYGSDPYDWSTDVFGQMVDLNGVSSPPTPPMGTPGNDIWTATAAAEHFNGGGGTDTVSYALAPVGLIASLADPSGNSGFAAGDTYVSIENLTGSNFADHLSGNDAANAINGGNGNDRLDGGLGNDMLNGGDGADTISAGDGNDSIYGGNHNDVIYGDAGQDYISGDDGNDMLYGNDGADSIHGSYGDDTLYGGSGDDYLSGGDGNDNLHGDSGNDRLNGGAQDDQLFGGNANDSLDGGTGNDILSGDDGNDVIVGGDGADVLLGGLGMDTLTGNAGRDVFVFDTALGKTNIDTITDFSVVDDTIKLSHAIFSKAACSGSLTNGTAHLTADAFFIGAKAHDSSDRIIYDSVTGALSYDPDGTGSAAPVQFATLQSGLKLTHNDFMIF